MSAAKKIEPVLILEFDTYDRYGSNYADRGVRKIRAQWNCEMAQDLAAYDAIDAEAELTALLTEEIAAEIELEIINNLFDINRNNE